MRVLGAVALAGALAVALLVVSSRAAHAETVPDVTGLPTGEAQTLLSGAGFRTRLTHHAGHPDGLVFSQEPPGWASRPRGSEVELRIGGRAPAGSSPTGNLPPSQPPSRPGTSPEDTPLPPPPTADAPMPVRTDAARAPALIPSLMGLPLSAARERAHGLRIRVEETLGVEAMLGHVISQWPASGTPAGDGTLTMVVGVKAMPSAQHAMVPDVTGLEPAAARAVLAEAGFSMRRSGARTTGTVAIHHPLPGSIARKGGSVEVALDGAPLTSRTGRTAPPAGVAPPRQSPPRPRTPAIGRPTARSPRDGDAYNAKIPVVFDWDGVAKATSYLWQLLRENDSGVWEEAARSASAQAPLRKAGLQPGRYQWRVRARVNGRDGPWATPRFLYIY